MSEQRKHTMNTRSMSNKPADIRPKSNTKKTPKPTKPLAEVLTEAELTKRGLSPDGEVDGWRKVIPAPELDLLCKDLRGKWAVAPEGWYWKAFSEKSYFWFDWFELRKIPENK